MYDVASGSSVGSNGCVDGLGAAQFCVVGFYSKGWHINALAIISLVLRMQYCKFAYSDQLGYLQVGLYVQFQDTSSCTACYVMSDCTHVSRC